MQVDIRHGDCREVMQTLDPESVDAVICDPPYGLSFMGKEWDSFKEGDIAMRRNPQMDAVNTGASRQGGRQRACVDYQKRQARDMLAFQEAMNAVFLEAIRVAKPGAHLLAFGGTRTYHRLACAIEDAGWEIRDCVMWVYGSGFPKSHDVSKAIDKAAGATRGRQTVRSKSVSTCYAQDEWTRLNAGTVLDAKAITPEAAQWSGWGTALKPSHEPVILARKPLPEDAERATIVENLSRLESQLCLLMSDAWLAEASLMSSRAVERLLGTARWSAEDRTNTRAALCDQMDTSQFELAIRLSLNTVSSWKSIWEDASVPTSTFITATASSTTIGWQTLKSCVSALTLPCIIQAASNRGGSWHDAVPAAAIFNAVSVSINSIRTLSAHASAIEQGLTPRPDAIDQQRLHRPIIVARKPLIGTVAENVLTHGTGGINVDGCRVGTEAVTINTWDDGAKPFGGGAGHQYTGRIVTGRWPANVIHDGSDEVVGLFPKTKTGICPADGASGYCGGLKRRNAAVAQNGGDSGSAARFFYCAKASKADRDEGCEGLERRKPAVESAHSTVCVKCNKQRVNVSGSCQCDEPEWVRVQQTPRGNHHPTVKPTALMRYLCRLVTPPGGVVLDPFTGSGSTGKAAILEGFRFIGIEREAEYVEIAKARIAAAEAGAGPLFA